MKLKSVQSARSGPARADREALKRFRIIFAATQRHYRQVERHCGVGGAQLWALAEVARKPGSSIGDLTDALLIHQTTASNLVERLCSLGLVRKLRSGADRRVAELFATRKGAALLRDAPRPAVGILQDALAKLPQPALMALNEALDHLIRCMRVRSSAAAATLISQMWTPTRAPVKRAEVKQR